MSLQDYIHTSHIGDNFIEDKELLVSKLVAQHRWSGKVYGKTDYAFNVAQNNVRYFEPLWKKTFEEYERIYPNHTKIDQPHTKKASYCLIQNKERNAYTWHNHDPNTRGQWYAPTVLVSSVYYIRLPEGSGGIKFRDDFEEIELMPSEGDLYFFPSNMSHTPSLNTCTDYRVSFNINISLKNL